MNANDPPDNDAQPPQKPPRRVRYSGTHPKNYKQKYKEHNMEAYPELKAHLSAKGKTPASTHIPVMTKEVLDCLKPMPSDVVIDCTLGYGGHASEFIERIGSAGKLIALDVDASELQRTKERLNNPANVSFHRSNFAGIANALSKENLDGFDIIFADLGISSMQIDDPDRGMSYKNNGPLDMRMDDRIKQTAADLLNTLSEKKLAMTLWELSDETDYEHIARQIVTQRTDKPITQTDHLVQIVFDAKGINQKAWRQRRRTEKKRSLHPAALTFQAMRMLVNDEIGCLKELLRVAPYCLKPGGRIGIISFHSGEDRIVKHSFRDGVRNGIYKTTAKEVIVPDNKEINANPRSASAKFRWAVK
ncbi:MAG: 16S rRNA (cytosine(1402)-N(4))-methyltransferase RsmH [Planctomycetes bacterium]|nr:16S rRNA (cytosine(1402)-N(4))-methyltransferase RsmH [Planctomycetota bacterium]